MRFSLILLGGVLARPAHADDTLRLTDVVTAAVRASPDLSRARIDVEEARDELRKAEGLLDVHVGATAQYQGQKQESVVSLGNDRFQVFGGTVYASKVLPTGGTATLSTGSTRTKSVAAFDGIERVGYQSGVTLTLVQPLLKGYGEGTVAAPIAQAGHTADAAAMQQEAKARDLIVSLATAYWQVALARSQLDVRRHSLELAQKQLDFTQAAIRTNTVAKSEILSVEVALATRQQDVIAAEQTVLEKSLALRQLAGLEIAPAALAVATEPLPDVKAGDVDLAATVAAAFEHSAQLAQLAAQHRAAQASVDRAESLAKSRLDLSVSVGPLATGADLASSVTNLASNTGYSAAVSLTYDHAVQGRIETGTLREARAELERTVVEDRAARADIALRTSRAVQRVKAALAAIALGDKAIASAEQNVEAEQHKFELAKSTNAEVLRRQDELEQARLRRVTAIVDYLSARAELDGLTGTILGEFGVTIR